MSALLTYFKRCEDCPQMPSSHCEVFEGSAIQVCPARQDDSLWIKGLIPLVEARGCGCQGRPVLGCVPQCKGTGKDPYALLRLCLHVAEATLEVACQGCASGISGTHDLCSKIQPGLSACKAWLEDPSAANLEAWKAATHWRGFVVIWQPHWTTKLKSYQDPADCMYHASKILGSERFRAVVFEAVQ